jgi:Gpi18-like mannosyltransferase
VYELGAAGRAYRLWSHNHFPNTTALNVFVKLPSLIAEIGLALLLFLTTRRALGPIAARWSAAAYWLNPAALLNATILGYLDAQFALPAVAAIVAAASGRGALAGALVAAAALTKPQGLLIAPAAVLGLWLMGRTHSPAAASFIETKRRVARLAAAAASGATVVAIVIAPFALAGALPNMVQAVERLMHHDMVSANGCNLWWIVGYVVRVQYSIHDMGAWAALTAPARILGISRMVQIEPPQRQCLR